MMMTRKKMLLWFTAFLIIMACAPAGMATPIPPLDSNAINTQIAERAQSALAQTQAAIPPSSPTPIFTPTLRNTFTPEPTFTDVPVIIFPTTTPNQRVQLYRVKHDTQLAEFNYKSRTAADSWPLDAWGWQTPEVYNMYPIRKAQSGTHRTVLDRSWEIYIDALNDNNKKVLDYLKADWTALFDFQGFPYLESKIIGGNVVLVDEVQGGWARIHTLDFKNPGSLKEVNYVTHPELVHKMVVIKYDKKNDRTVWINAPVGPMVYPLVSDVPLWLQTEYLEPFPILPMIVTSLKTQPFRYEPSSTGKETGKEFLQYDFIRIVEYHPSASNVWARTPDGWIALVLNRKYYTDWSMATIPPPP